MEPPESAASRYRVPSGLELELPNASPTTASPGFVGNVASSGSFELVLPLQSGSLSQGGHGGSPSGALSPTTSVTYPRVAPGALQRSVSAQNLPQQGSQSPQQGAGAGAGGRNSTRDLRVMTSPGGLLAAVPHHAGQQYLVSPSSRRPAQVVSDWMTSQQAYHNVIRRDELRMIEEIGRGEFVGGKGA